MGNTVTENIKKYGHARLIKMIQADLEQNAKNISSEKNVEKRSALKQERISLNQLKDLVREDRAMKNLRENRLKEKLRGLSARGSGGGAITDLSQRTGATAKGTLFKKKLN